MTGSEIATLLIIYAAYLAILALAICITNHNKQ